MRLILAIILGALSMATAGAADLPLRKAQPLPAAIDSWAGFYVTLGGGQNLGAFSPGFGVGAAATTVNLDDNSWFVGGETGYLMQSGVIAFGPAVGVQYWDFKSRAQVVPGGTETAAVFLQERVDLVAYFNMRLGIALSSVYVYGFGGVAWAHVKGELINLAALDTANEQSLLGWNAGAGVEYKLSQSVALGVEYRHFDFGKVQSVNPTLALALGVTGERLTNNQVMGRATFRPSLDRY